MLAGFLLLAGPGSATAERGLEEGEIRGGVYFSEEIGWSMPVPDGWDVMSRERAAALEARGQESVTSAIGMEIDTEGLKDLLVLQKDDSNAFQSSSQPFVEQYEGEWAETNLGVRDILIDTYVNAGLEVEYSDILTEEIDGVPFQVYQLLVYGPDGNALLAQTMYSTLLNGFDFGAGLTYNSTENRDQLLEAWRASKFTPVN